MSKLESSKQTKSAANEENNENDESLDYSFDFREAARRSSKQQQQPNANEAPQAALVELTGNFQQKKPTQSSGLLRRKSSEKNLMGANSPVRSSNYKKSSQINNKQSQKMTTSESSKRLRQLTMTQALTCLNETASSVPLSSSSINRMSNLKQVNVKDEPITLVNIRINR